MGAVKYLVIIEKGDSSYGAHVPDLPGCVAVGETEEDVLNLIHDAIEFHLEGLQENGGTIPIPRSAVEYIEVGVA